MLLLRASKVDYGRVICKVGGDPRARTFTLVAKMQLEIDKSSLKIHGYLMGLKTIKNGGPKQCFFLVEISAFWNLLVFKV